MMRLQDQVAIVTGAGSGIGAETAVSLAMEGCRVLAIGRRQETLDGTVARNPERIAAAAVDVTDRAAIEATVADTLSQYGRIDILVNSAGVNIVKRTSSETSPEDWDFVINVNATGAFHCIQSVLPQMQNQGGGTIVNISSVAGRRSGPLGGLAYNASKFAMSAVGITVGEEHKDDGVRVTNIYPGEVETPILDRRPVPVSAEHRARILQPEDVAAACLLACTLPSRARIPELVIVPTSQSFV